MLLTPRQCNGISVPFMVTDFPQCRPQEMQNPNQELQRLRMQACRAQKNQTCGLKDTLVLVVVACYVLSDWDLPLAEAVGRMLLEELGQPWSRLRRASPVPLESWFERTHDDTVSSFFLPGEQQHHRIRAEALRWIAQLRCVR